MQFARFVYRPLSEDQKNHAIKILTEINGYIKLWTETFPKFKHKGVRNALFRNNGSLPLSMTQNELFQTHVARIAVLRGPQAEFDGRDIETTMLEGFSALCVGFARKWQNDSAGLSHQDLTQECYMKICESIYYWCPEGGGGFMTYIFRSITNRMVTIVNSQGRLLSRLKSTGKKLIAKYNEARKLLPDADVAEVIESMNLKEKSKSHLIDILATVAMSSQIDNDGVTDYSAMGKIQKTTENDLKAEEMFVQEILENSSLNETERKLIEAAMNPYHGWQAAIGQTILNKNNGKPYSKMRISQILSEAKGKVARTIERLSNKRD